MHCPRSRPTEPTTVRCEVAIVVTKRITQVGSEAHQPMASRVESVSGRMGRTAHNKKRRPSRNGHRDVVSNSAFNGKLVA